MNGIRFKNICKNYESTSIIKDLNLDIKQGERIIILGPSGCGKSTTLRMIAGLETISSGELYLGEKLANDVEPGDRNIAMVFQNYALYPHLTIFDNITFGLRMNRVPKEEIEKRASEAVKILNLKGLEKRYPKELSGGQRQRVALARALVKRSPYFLLDEPLSNLDAQLRTSARGELVKIHELYNPTFVYVTHDQVEAMTIGHRIAVLDKGKLQQLDTPDNIYNKPVNTFVAKFIGSPSMNLMEAVVKGNRLILGSKSLEIPEVWLNVIKLNKENSVVFGVRPENVTIKNTNNSNSLPMKMKYIENHGNRKCIYFDLDGNEMLATVDSDYSVNNLDNLYYSIDWSKVHFFNKDGNNFGYPKNIKEEVELIG
ncbi:ABC transporter ATP-binding protein [Clostridium arbusti]|uniref:ABC transporter ATP-binding protein n=1 Tax=Clostridium arbusti TaxID=1137848 RepID=UPI00028966ED|nr:ABC transporter ATP-binding protein [Clostridium arbusti]